jgi:hypothetical protein
MRQATLAALVSASVLAISGCGPRSTGGTPDGGTGADAPGCVGLQCDQVTCPAGGTTRLVGTVVAPTPVDPDPVPNAVVYVPNEAVQPFPQGVECSTCGSPLSGAPLVQAYSNTDGTFSIDNMPVGADVPVVIQLGRWRRQVRVAIEACVDNALPAEASHLPHRQSEGDIPKMALVTGQLDALECTLAKIIDPAELTAPGGSGRVHLYRRNGNDLPSPLPGRESLLADLSTLMQYDAVLLPCPSHEAYTATEAENLRAYADLGGRILNTHGGGFWLFEPAVAYPGLVAFNNQPDPDVDFGTVDTSFPKGEIFADWLMLIGATATYAQIPIAAPQWFVDGVSAPAQSWVATTGPTTIQHLTFNTPVEVAPENQCGRVLFSNFHVGSSTGPGLYPDSCIAGPLTPDEQLIEFMLFDVTACVQPDVIE